MSGGGEKNGGGGDEKPPRSPASRDPWADWEDMDEDTADTFWAEIATKPVPEAPEPDPGPDPGR